MRRTTIVMSVLAVVLVTAACATSWLASMEQAEMSAFLTLDRFVAIEKTSGPALEALAPGSHALANEVRLRGPDLLLAWDNALAAYRANPGSDTRAEVARVAAVVQSLAADAQRILLAWDGRQP